MKDFKPAFREIMLKTKVYSEKLKQDDHEVKFIYIYIYVCVYVYKGLGIASSEDPGSILSATKKQATRVAASYLCLVSSPRGFALWFLLAVACTP